MALVELPASPLAPGVSPVWIHYRDAGAGTGAPLVILHGGWGYEIYPFDRQIAALAPSHRIVIPDRTGYGGSGRLERQEIDFGSSIRLQAGAQINFGATYGEIVDANAPAYWQQSESAGATRGHFVARHWRGRMAT